jgi:hypothetical protein
MNENGRTHVLLTVGSTDGLTRLGHDIAENKAEKIQCQREKMSSELETTDAWQSSETVPPSDACRDQERSARIRFRA